MPTVITWTDDSGAAVTASFDGDMQETHETSATVTEHPVEEGLDVADHIRVNPRRYQVEGVVTDSPTLGNPGAVDELEEVQIELQIPEYPQQISLSAGLQAGIGAIGDAVFGKSPPLKVTMLRFENFKSRKRAFLELLEGAIDAGSLVRVITSMKEYDGMAIESVVCTRAPDDGDAAVFTVSLKQVATVTSDITVAPEPSEVLGAVKKAAGSRTTENDKDKIAAKRKSLLARLGDSSGVTDLVGIPGGF
jgi:hypothetical protein